MVQQDNRETTEAYNWLGATDGAIYQQAKEEAGYGIYRFRVWAEDALTRIPEWDDEDTAEVDYESLMKAVLSE